MSTLLQSIDKFIENITVTDRQEENIETSFQHLKGNLTKNESNLSVKEVFLNGSYERDTIIRPLDDVDLFAVIDHADYAENGQDPNSQSVLTKFKNYLNSLSDYKDKVKQDRPCITIMLSDKNFDVLPSLRISDRLYIPNKNLSSWTLTDPVTHTDKLNQVDRNRNHRVKPIIKAIKQWKREKNQDIPSFHIEEIAIDVFYALPFTNLEEGIRKWFEYAEFHLRNNRFESDSKYSNVKKSIVEVKSNLLEAKRLLDNKKESEAKKIWKDIFGKEFPVLDDDEAKTFSNSFSKGTLKHSMATGLSLSTGTTIANSGGFYGELY